MTKKITVDKIAFEARDLSYSTAETDRETVERIITDFYAWKKLAAPKFVYVDGPLAAYKLAYKNGAREFGAMFGHQYEEWAISGEYARQTGKSYGAEVDRRLGWWWPLAKACGWWWPFERVCIVSRRPVEAHWVMQGYWKILHGDGVPALRYADGLCVWKLHGVTVPKELVMTPADQLRPETLATYQNAQVRAEFIRKLGIHRLMEVGKVIETVRLSPHYTRREKKPMQEFQQWIDRIFSGSPHVNREKWVYHLVDFGPLLGLPKALYLAMVNPSMGEIHAEGVSNDCTDVDSALSFRHYGVVGGIPWRPEHVS